MARDLLADGPVREVDPLQGTDSHHGFSRGNTLPLVARPFGMTAWSPQTGEGGWFFDPRERKLQGIRATHQPSPWIGDYGHFVVMAQTGAPNLSPRGRAAAHRPEDTVIAPHWLRATLLRYDTTIELTPTERCAVVRVRFPRGGGRIIIDTFAGASSFAIDRDGRSLTAMTRAQDWKATTDAFATHIVATCSAPITGFGLFHGDEIWRDRAEHAGERVGAFLEFASEVVELRIATSFIDAAQARLSLAREIGERPFDAVRAEGATVWNDMLGRAAVEGGSDAERRVFYSCLYRALLFPRIWYEIDDAGAPRHHSPYDGGVHPGVLYADNGFWDTYRTVYPLLALLYPERLAEILEGWVQAAREGGWFPSWSSPGYKGCMIGSHSDAIIADAVVKGVRGFDLEAAYAACRRNGTEPGDDGERFGRRALGDYHALGYVPADRCPGSVARTLDNAYNDFCLAQIARALGRAEDHGVFAARAANYRNVFDARVGFMRGRNADGSWLEPFGEFTWGDPYIECGPWQATWAVPHDPAGLIALLGGAEAAAAKLDRMLALPPTFAAGSYGMEIHEMTEMAAAAFGQYAHSNQPVHHVLWLYACAGRPDRTQHWVRRVLAELYTPDAFPGDEDNGEMASWYVLGALGVFPLCPGHPTYVLGSPVFPKATLRLAGGRRLVITAESTSRDRVYVDRVQRDGAEHRALWIGHDDLMRGGELAFTMAATPAPLRTYGVDELPFSLSTAAGAG
ncbi:MAG TPA: GH92 family glycosyl hydrolase [Planctomycetota bacterium]|nr:GH92 family glycosyl hydrolase [Planctomycetota bacterium]